MLRPLSREHHHGLVLARRAGRWAAGDAGVQRRGWTTIRQVYESELRSHFEQEEAHVLPIVARTRADLVARTLDDHRRLRNLALTGSTSRELGDLGHLLDAHIRFEERQLFPAVEKALEDGR